MESLSWPTLAPELWPVVVVEAVVVEDPEADELVPVASSSSYNFVRILDGLGGW
jgi:hypothetical protein